MTDALAISEDIRESLTEKEVNAYREHVAHRPREQFGEDLSEQGWNLFKAGQTCGSIAGILALKLGQVVRLRVEKGWDERLEECRKWQTTRASAHHNQTRLESLTWIQMNLAAARILSEKRLLMFIATREFDQLRPEDIQQLENPAQLKQWIDLMDKLSGQAFDGT